MSSSASSSSANLSDIPASVIDGRTTAAASTTMDIKLIIPLLKKVSKRTECEFFKEPFNYAEVGFFDYPHIIQCPMAISNVLASIDSSNSRNDSSNHVYTIEMMLKQTRLIWRNAMIYNAAGSHVYNAAKTLSTYWEAQWPLVFPGHIDNDENRPPRKDDVKLLIELFQFMDCSEMSNLIRYLDENNPMCLFKLIETNEIQINMDLIPHGVCHNILQTFRLTDK